MGERKKSELERQAVLFTSNSSHSGFWAGNAFLTFKTPPFLFLFFLSF
jgi:hypothetical protein